MLAKPFVCAGAVILILHVAASSLVSAQNTNPGEGKRLFDGMCSGCHGFEGTGAQGPNLNRLTLTRAQDDESLRAIIRDGIPERGMPRVRRMTDREITQLAAYVRSLGRAAARLSSGNIDKGSAIYRTAGCASCHIIKGDGAAVGPELTSIGAIRGPDYLRRAILDPGSVLPVGTSPVPARNLSEFLPVRITTREGRELEGVRINEDSFTIQLRDAKGQFLSFRKADLRDVQKEFGKSLMPGYKDRIAGTELDDLVAYLSSLGGAK